MEQIILFIEEKKSYWTKYKQKKKVIERSEKKSKIHFFS